ncbi:MAG: methionyl-tRNA formyltransferase [Lachnospiraceae bacterium]|jgi:methionyl-tRNA formyltransferase|nr:methionyl-tRNA formyltransferase [Lachnospiraceae bacterium]
MKIVFMGTPDFSVGILKALSDAGYEITGVITQPDRPKGRKMEPSACPVAEEAKKLGLPLFQPEKVRTPEAVGKIRAMEPDLIAVAAFGQIIPKEILEMPKYGCVNVHASLLPAYRGAAPIQQAILDGKKTTGVTIMRMDEGLDTGDIISQKEVEIAEDETGGSLFDRLAGEGAALLIATIPSIADGTAVYTKQPAESTTPYAKMLKKEAGLIDWTKSAGEIERRIRALNPWPSAYAVLDRRMFKIWKAHVEKPDMTGKTGFILRQDHKGIYVQTGEGILCLDEVQLEGRKRMPTSEFLKGYVIRNNDLNR